MKDKIKRLWAKTLDFIGQKCPKCGMRWQYSRYLGCRHCFTIIMIEARKQEEARKKEERILEIKEGVLRALKEVGEC